MVEMCFLMQILSAKTKTSVLSMIMLFLLQVQLSRCDGLNREHSGDRHVVPLHRQRVPVKSEDGVVSFKSIYFGNVFLGAPIKQHFSVVFDTGSGHVIIPSRECESETCTIHKRYDPRISATATEVDYDGTRVTPGAARDQITVAFGTGEVTGQFTDERVCLGVGKLGSMGESEPAVVATPKLIADVQMQRGNQVNKDPQCVDMRVVTATEMSHEPFASFAFDGVVGLGLDGLALAPEFSFFGVMSQYANLSQKSFGVFLADSDDDFSEISFGGHNPLRVKSPLAWAPVAMPEAGHWQVRVLAIRVNGVTLDFCNDGQCRAVVDTGTSLIAVPGGLVDTLQDELETELKDPPQKADGSVDCRKAQGRLLEFDIEGGTTLSFGPGDYARAAVQMEDGDDEEAAQSATAALSGQADNDQSSTTDVSQEKQTKCHPTLMPIDLPEPLGPKLFIWGEPVLRKYYTTYDWGEKRIGFGLAANDHDDDDDVEVKPPAPEMRRPLLTMI